MKLNKLLFRKKNNEKFERGECIRVKDGVKYPELNIALSDWHGRIMEVEEETVEVELDSITLGNFNETLLNHYKTRWEYPHIVTIPKEDIEKTEPRDEYHEVELAQDKLIAIIDAENKQEPKYKQKSRKWVRHFIRSEIYQSMEKKFRVETDAVTELFSNQMFNYEKKVPRKWTVRSAKAVFLNWAPNKITADKAFFEAYGEVLLKYFEFLESRKYLKTNGFHKLLKEVKETIVIKSQDRSGWGPAKSFMMKAKESGVNLDSEEDIDKFMRKEQMRALAQLSHKKRK